MYHCQKWHIVVTIHFFFFFFLQILNCDTGIMIQLKNMSLFSWSAVHAVGLYKLLKCKFTFVPRKFARPCIYVPASTLLLYCRIDRRYSHCTPPSLYSQFVCAWLSVCRYAHKHTRTLWGDRLLSSEWRWVCVDIRPLCTDRDSEQQNARPHGQWHKEKHPIHDRSNSFTSLPEQKKDCFSSLLLISSESTVLWIGYAT